MALENITTDSMNNYQLKNKIDVKKCQTGSMNIKSFYHKIMKIRNDSNINLMQNLFNLHAQMKAKYGTIHKVLFNLDRFTTYHRQSRLNETQVAGS